MFLSFFDWLEEEGAFTEVYAAFRMHIQAYSCIVCAFIDITEGCLLLQSSILIELNETAITDFQWLLFALALDRFKLGR